MTHPQPETMILKLHLLGALSYDIGNEIWHVALADAIRTEAEAVAEHATAELLQATGQTSREGLTAHVIAEMTAALKQVGDRYRAADGVPYALLAESEAETGDTLRAMTPPKPVVEEVLRFENLQLGSMATRRAVVRWSDGTEGEALRYYDDEVLFAEGDLIGKTLDQIQTLHGHRDRGWLQGAQ